MGTSWEEYRPAARRRRPLGPAPGRREAVTRALRALRETVARHPRRWAFVLYVLLSLLTLGWRMLPDPGVACACEGNDPPTFMWALEWWPYALVHGLNPLYTHYVWSPIGANVTRSTTIPTIALALSPLTALFGPLVSYNVLTLASPALAAFTAFLLARHIVGRELPALLAGYLFGFGAYELPQLVGHPNLSLVFLVPLMVLLALRRAEGEVGPRTYVLVMALLIVAQLGISTEVLTTTVLLGFAMLLAATLLAPRARRRRIDRVVAETVLAGWIAAILAAPFLYYALLKGGVPAEAIADRYDLDLLNPLVPTVATWVGGSALHGLSAKFEAGAFAETDGYLSLPLLAAFLFWASRTRRRFLARMLVVAAALSFLAALGARLHVAGSETIVLPYALIKGLPLIKLLTPSRIAMYTSLAVAIGVAAWLAESRPRSRERLLRWAIAGLGAVMVFPNLGGEIWSYPPPPPPFFRSGIYRRYLTPGETILPLPYAQNGTAMGWQAECHLCFRMPEGYLGHAGGGRITEDPAVGSLESNSEVDPAQLERFVHAYGVREIVVGLTPRIPTPYPLEFARLGMRGVAVGGVIVYHVPPDGL